MPRRPRETSRTRGTKTFKQMSGDRIPSAIILFRHHTACITLLSIMTHRAPTSPSENKADAWWKSPSRRSKKILAPSVVQQEGATSHPLLPLRPASAVRLDFAPAHAQASAPTFCISPHRPSMSTPTRFGGGGHRLPTRASRMSIHIQIPVCIQMHRHRQTKTNTHIKT